MAPTEDMRIFLLVAALLCALVASACARKCRNADHCERACECRATTSDRVVACNVFFTCDVATETCHPDFANKTCDEICQEFAAPDEQGDTLCGRRRCTIDTDCDRTETCTQTAPGPDGNPQVVASFECTVDVFRCDTGIGFCEEAASASQATICAQCPPPGAQ
jgi:hypothetical protein